jgi:hypothetical protein
MAAPYWSFTKRLFSVSAWKPSGISGTVATAAALQMGQGAPAPPQPEACLSVTPIDAIWIRSAS